MNEKSLVAIAGWIARWIGTPLLILFGISFVMGFALMENPKATVIVLRWILGSFVIIWIIFGFIGVLVGEISSIILSANSKKDQELYNIPLSVPSLLLEKIAEIICLVFFMSLGPFTLYFYYPPEPPLSDYDDTYTYL